MLIYDGVQQTEFSVIEREYRAGSDVFADDPPVVRCLDKLPEKDRQILILCAELGSVRKVAQVLGCGKSTIDRRMGVIKQFIWNRIC